MIESNNTSDDQNGIGNPGDHLWNRPASKVVFDGKNVIEGNNKAGNQNGKGNPGNHPLKNLADGQVCLP